MICARGTRYLLVDDSVRQAMGRIKGLFCSCLDNGADYSNNEPTFDRNLDVSHLATPHITSTVDRALTPSTCRNTAEDKYSNNYSSPQRQRLQQPQQQQQHHHHHNHNTHSEFVEQHSGEPSAGSSVRPSSSLNRGSASPSQPSSSSPFAPSPVDNLYEPAQQRENNIQAPSSPELPHQQLNEGVQPQFPPPPLPLIQSHNSPSTSNSTAAKLSYDIISVREPLAKILAERQQLLLSQQQQRQILGDHEYIEVYGERSSSCFYEEIAGSVTSSATYDQIGAVSNHNYQVLINAYAVANRQAAGNPGDEPDDRNNPSNGLPDSNNNQHDENAYDVTSNTADQVDGSPSTSNVPSTGLIVAGVNVQGDTYERTSPNHIDGARMTQSIPVYSVINKATRRGSSIMRKTFDSTTPPEPPPKNLFISQHQQPSTSAMTTYNEPFISTFQNDLSHALRSRSPVPQIPSTSSYSELNHDLKDPSKSPVSKHRNSRLPQPPPRFSKQSAFSHTTDRPLPSPSKLEKATNNQKGNIPTTGEEEDIDTLENGYELLKSNLDDDQIDVGYEKIREPNRYSGGSISSQFYSRQYIDNGGYESVQPIYSSPSNCYEVLTPATASEIAAAAAAKLNVIEKSLKKDQ